MEADEAHQMLKRIQEKLEQLRALDTNYQVFNAQAHRYRLNPCLSSQQIDALEQRSQILLPAEYRLFLQEIGNGGAGPDYGIFPLEQSLECRWDDWEKWFPEMSDYLQEPFVPPTSPDDTGPFDEAWGPGLLVLGHIGCGEFNYLVLSGVEYGHIWEGSDMHPLPACCFSDLPEEIQKGRGKDFYSSVHRYLLSPAHKQRLTFLAWYEHWWLDSELRKLAKNT